MNWKEYAKVVEGIDLPTFKPVSTKSKLIVAEGLCNKNLLKMPAKPTPNMQMENDLHRFLYGKPRLEETPFVAAPLLATGVTAQVAPEVIAPAAGLLAADKIDAVANAASTAKDTVTNAENKSTPETSASKLSGYTGANV